MAQLSKSDPSTRQEGREAAMKGAAHLLESSDYSDLKICIADKEYAVHRSIVWYVYNFKS